MAADTGGSSTPTQNGPGASPRGPLRRWLYSTIFEHHTRAGWLFDVGLLVAILASIIVVMLESVASLQESYGATLRTTEWVLTGLFTLEYVTRLACHRKPGRYARSFFGVVDLLAILPTYVGAFFPGAQALLVVRMLRLLRIFRVLKLAHFVRQANDLSAALRASLPKIIVFMISVVTLTTISGSVMYLIEGPEHGYDNIPESVYWAVVTLTTVGYGDISPETPLGQIVASFIMIMGYGVIAVPTGIVSAELVRTPFNPEFSGQVCADCGSLDHAMKARFCDLCGATLDE